MIFYLELSDPHSYPRSTLSLASLARQSYSLTPPPTQTPNPQCSQLSWASLARQSYSLTPPPTQSPNPQCSQLTMLFFKVSYKTFQFLFPAQWFLPRAFRSSLLPRSTLSLASLARQSYSLTPPPTQTSNPQCSQLTMLLLKVSYKTIQFLFPTQWSFT